MAELKITMKMRSTYNEVEFKPFDGIMEATVALSQLASIIDVGTTLKLNIEAVGTLDNEEQQGEPAPAAESEAANE